MIRSLIKNILASAASLIILTFGYTSALAAAAPSIKAVARIDQGLELPGKLDVDGFGNLYVSDLRAKAVLKFNRYGKYVGRYGNIEASGRGLAVRADGQVLYVALARPRGAVGIYSSEGVLLGLLGKAEGEFGVVVGVALDAAGNVYVADSGECLVRVYSSDGRFIRNFGINESVSRGMAFPSINTMALNARTSELYIGTNSFTAEAPAGVRVYDLNGNLLRFYSNAATGDGSGVKGFGETTVGRFAGICFDPQGHVFYLDSFHSNIRVLSEDGTWEGSHSPAYGDGLGMLTTPFGAAFDPLNGYLYVSSGGKGIQVYAVNGGTGFAGGNIAPTIPQPQSPVAGTRVGGTPLLVTANAQDVDGDALVYDFALFQAGNPVDSAVAVVQGPSGRTEFQVGARLHEDWIYHWQVRAFDGMDYSGWSELQSFVVNAQNDPPTAPVALSPLSGERMQKTGTLRWSASVDPDPSDQVSYAVEVSKDPGFAVQSAGALLGAQEVALGGLSNYESLQVGREYFWRVVAVDSVGLRSEPSIAGRFVYDASLLKVGANMPGSRVYLGGNLGYAGRYVGQAPVEIKDIPVGIYSVVVERAGFEPLVTQVQVGLQAPAEVYAELVPASVAGGYVKQSMVLVPVMTEEADPFFVDYDMDGVLDLLVGDGAGALILYRGIADAQGPLRFEQGRDLGLILPMGISPFVVDWNNDGKIDVLVGARDGSLTLLLNDGSQETPSYRQSLLPMTDGSYVSMDAGAVPAVVDFDQDGDKDLVLGSSAGVIKLFRNIGSDASAQFAASETLVSVPGGALAPFFADLDGNGVRDFLVAEGGAVYKYQAQPDGRWARGALVSATEAGLPVAAGENLKIFVADVDGAPGKDMLIGNAAGELVLLRAAGRALAPSVGEALLEKAAQVSTLANEAGAALPVSFDLMVSAIRAGDFAKAASFGSDLGIAGGTNLELAVGELRRLLEQISQLL